VLRKNIPYNRRRFERSASNRVEIVTAPADVERALADYEAVYLSSWKIPEAYPEFIRGLVSAAAARGWLRLGLAYVDGKPAAAQIWFVCSGAASIYKIAYDEEYSKLSVGTVLTARLMEHVLEVDKVKTVDYLSGDDDYKSKWMSARREFWGLLAFNPRSLPGGLQIAKHVGGRFIKRKLSAMSSWRRRVLSRQNGAGA
jgi:CelD/BcsL family acetyltransferase involved in cellulose biosynthesis